MESAFRRWRARSAWVVAGVAALGVTLSVRSEARSPSCLEAERLVLPNGVEVVLRADHALPLVAMVSSVHAGFRNDPPNYLGLAHYVEHLTYRAAPPFQPTFELYRQTGATDLNGTTGIDTTNYFALVPREQLELALWIEGRRLAIGLDALTEQAAKDERRVVEREEMMRRGPADSPLRALHQLTGESLFPAGHPYRIEGNGAADLGALTLDGARWFFARYYRPDRVRLVLAGDFDGAVVKQWIEKDFGSLAARPAPASAPGFANASVAAECKSASAPPPDVRGHLVVTTRYRVESVEFVWPAPLDPDPERSTGAFRAFAHRFADAARDASLSGDVHFGLERNELSAHWSIEVPVTPGASLEKVEPLARSIFDELVKAPPDESDLGAQRQAFELGTASEESSLMAVAHKLASRECQPSSCVGVDQVFARTKADLRRFDPRLALVIAHRFSQAASANGSVEKLP